MREVKEIYLDCCDLEGEHSVSLARELVMMGLIPGAKTVNDSPTKNTNIQMIATNDDWQYQLDAATKAQHILSSLLSELKHHEMLHHVMDSIMDRKNENKKDK